MCPIYTPRELMFPDFEEAFRSVRDQGVRDPERLAEEHGVVVTKDWKSWLLEYDAEWDKRVLDSDPSHQKIYEAALRDEQQEQGTT